MLYCVCSERSVLLNKNYQMFSQLFLLGVCVGGGGVEENSIFFGLKTLVRFVSEPFFTKRAAVRKSLLSVFVKEQLWANCSLKRVTWDRIALSLFCSQKRAICSIKFVVFTMFSLLFHFLSPFIPFYAQERIAPAALRSLKKRVCEQIALVAL